MFSAADREKLITTLWMIWTSRNSWTHHRGSFNQAQAINMGKEALFVLELPKKMAATLPAHG
jgi:hypothetical protein